MAIDQNQRNLNEYERYASTVKFIAIKSVSLFFFRNRPVMATASPILFLSRMLIVQAWACLHRGKCMKLGTAPEQHDNGSTKMKMKYYVWFILLHFHFDSKDITLYAASGSLHKEQFNICELLFTLTAYYTYNFIFTHTQTEWEKHSYYAVQKLGVELQTETNTCITVIILQCAECPETASKVRWQWICARRKIGPTYLWMFLRFFCFAFRRYSSLSVCRGNITWIRYICNRLNS